MAYLNERVVQQPGQTLQDEVEVLLPVDAGEVVYKQVLHYATLQMKHSIMNSPNNVPPHCGHPTIRKKQRALWTFVSCWHNSIVATCLFFF